MTGIDDGHGEEGLWSLVAARAEPGADKASIDRAARERFGEVTTVMFTDLVGFSLRAAEFGIMHFLQVIHEHERLMLPIVERRGGELVKRSADSLLLRFPAPVDAVDCAADMVAASAAHNRDRPPEERILIGMGIGHGEVLRARDGDLWGEEVNAASVLGEDCATAGEILITDAARSALGETRHRLTPVDHGPPGAATCYRVEPSG